MAVYYPDSSALCKLYVTCDKINFPVRAKSALNPLILIPADAELNVAALTEGLIVEDPNLRP